MWSRCGWVTTTRSRLVRPCRRSHRAAASPSPASTRIRAPGVSSRNASPCPTSIAVTLATLTGRRPSNGWTPVSTTASTVRVAAARARRVPRPPSTHAPAASSPATVAGRVSSTTPPTPAKPLAAASTIRAGQPAAAKTHAPASSDTSETSAPANPSVAATAPAGTATRLAGTDDRPTSPKVVSSNGTTASCAPTVIDSSSASRRGKRRGSRCRTTGARTSTPAVAVADSSSPSDPASRGSTSTSSSTATATACRGSRTTPRIVVPSSSRAIVPARSTLGSKRVTKANQGTTLPTAAQRPHAGARRIEAAASTPPITIATWLPETAVRCVSPVARIASRSASGSSRVSPMTKPTSRPPTRSSR
jgi:hypothetical protein